jgi:hypothetical protein
MWSGADRAARALGAAPLLGPDAALAQALSIINATNSNMAADPLLSQLRANLTLLFDALNRCGERGEVYRA